MSIKTNSKGGWLLWASTVGGIVGGIFVLGGAGITVYSQNKSSLIEEEKVNINTFRILHDEIEIYKDMYEEQVGTIIENVNANNQSELNLIEALFHPPPIDSNFLTFKEKSFLISHIDRDLSKQIIEIYMLFGQMNEFMWRYKEIARDYEGIRERYASSLMMSSAASSFYYTERERLEDVLKTHFENMIKHHKKIKSKTNVVLENLKGKLNF